MGLGPVPATQKVLEKLNLNIEDIDLFEMNEAFAAQSIAVTRLLNLDVTKVNTRGGGNSFRTSYRSKRLSCLSYISACINK